VRLNPIATRGGEPESPPLAAPLSSYVLAADRRVQIGSNTALQLPGMARAKWLGDEASIAWSRASVDSVSVRAKSHPCAVPSGLVGSRHGLRAAA